jgi:hypothetical protein
MFNFSLPERNLAGRAAAAGDRHGSPNKSRFA